MMGVICNLLLDYADQVNGEATRKAIEKRMGGKTYKDGHIYPESDFQTLFSVVCEECGVREDKAQDHFGQFCAQAVSEKFTGYFERSKNSRELFRIVPSIHTQYPVIAAYGESVDVFPSAKIIILKDEGDELVYVYHSPNKLCTFLMAMAKWVSQAYYREKIEIHETHCVKNGEEFCRIVMKWKS